MRPPPAAARMQPWTPDAMSFELVILVVALALLFDFFNGFNDAANSIATIVATRVLTPLQAVAWAAFFNFVSAFTFGTGVAKTIGAGMVNLDYVTPFVVLSGLLGSISWIYGTSMLGLPVSASHALIGGYAGAVISRAQILNGFDGAFDALVWSGWIKPMLFIVASPILGLLVAYTMMLAVFWAFRKTTPHRMDVYFRRLQLVSSAVFSYSHGTNDAQKTMAIITVALFTGGVIEEFQVPIWVIFSAHACIALGTIMGGWRVVQTMGSRITRLKPREGFCAETGGAFAVMFATLLGQPVSTTHTIAGAIAGVGVVRRVRAVRWNIAQRIVYAWILTIPCSAFVGWISFQAMRFFLSEP
jgi:inorganic phosphate transporter, PiT family